MSGKITATPIGRIITIFAAAASTSLGACVEMTAPTNKENKETIRFVTFARENQVPGNSTPPNSGDTGADNTLTPPSAFRGQALSPTAIALAWDASFTPSVTYRIYRDQNLVATLTGTYFEDTGLSPQGSYSYQIDLVSSSGAASSRSPAVTLTTLSASDPQRAVSLNPANSSALPAFDATTANDLHLSLAMVDNPTSVSGAQFYRVSPKNLTAVQRAAPECGASTFVNFSNPALIKTILFCTAAGMLQELIPIGEFVNYAAAEKISGVSVTFRTVVQAGALPTGTHQLGVVIVDPSGASGFYSRTINLSP